MLVLSRKVGEELVIGDNIRIVITRVAGNRVAVGIKAPLDVPVLRGELKEIHDSFEVTTEDSGDEEESPSRACFASGR